MGFMHPFTCPEIDKAIDEFHENLEGDIKSLLFTLCPEFVDKVSEKFIDSEVKLFVHEIYESGLLEDAFEKVRSSNEDIRSSAESQIEELEEKIDKLETELSDKDHEIKYCDEIIHNLENEAHKKDFKIEELEGRIEDLESGLM